MAATQSGLGATVTKLALHQVGCLRVRGLVPGGQHEATTSADTLETGELHQLRHQLAAGLARVTGRLG